MINFNNLETFRTKITAGKTCIGFVVSLNDATVSEMAGELGYDFTWIDMEHCSLNIETVLQHVRAVKGSECAPFVRIKWNQWGVIKPILDISPAGVIIPMVNSEEDAVSAVSSCRYPPLGSRGCGIRRGSRYGNIPFTEYLKMSEHNPMVILQIEHINAVRNLDSILKVPGIDSICIGPADLSSSMGKPCQFADTEVQKVLDEIAFKVKKNGIMLGTADCYTQAWKNRGVDWIACTGDSDAIISTARAVFEKVKHM